MTKIAIVTGATGGIGQKFIEKISLIDEIEKIWAVGRNREKLDSVANRFSKVVPIETDLYTEGVSDIIDKLKKENPDVGILVNNAGVAYMGPFEDMSPEDIERFLRINCTVPALLMNEVLPFMKEGAEIINVSSASSFQPNPYLAMYSASKVFLKNLSRAVGFELKKRKITVTTVCPGWVDTGMLPREKDGKKISYTGMISPEEVVTKALKDSAKGKDMSVPGFFAKYFRFYSKVTPTRLIMKLWTKAIGKYI